MKARFPRGTIMNLEGPVACATIRCASGAIWITQAGDARDYLVHAGERYDVCRKGSVVIQVLEESRLSVDVPGGAPGAVRLSLPVGGGSGTGGFLSRWRRCLPFASPQPGGST